MNRSLFVGDKTGDVDFEQLRDGAGRQGVMSTSHRLVIVLSLFAAACGSSSENNGTGATGVSGDCKAGPNAAYADPAGAAYALPAGIEIVSATAGGKKDTCYFDVTPLEYGGDLIDVCLKLKNTTTAAIKVNLPAGLLIKPTRPERMSGILLQTHDVNIEAGQTKQVFIKQTSINEHCVFTQKDDAYTLGVVVSDPALGEIIGLMKDKKTSVDTATATQKAVWQVTDRGGLTEEDRSALAALPKK